MPAPLLALLACLALVLAAPAGAARAEGLSPGTGPRHGLAMHGAPALPEGFDHFPFVNPQAPAGGELILGELGTYDSLNPFILKGTAPLLMREIGTATLMARSPDEPFTVYGYIARTIEVPEDRSWVTFTLDPRARFSDGSPVTVDDVEASMELLRGEGSLPSTRGFYAKIIRVDRPGEGQIRFVFDPAERNPELPLIMARMPVFSKAWYEAHPFAETTLTPPVTAAPYRVVAVDQGRSLSFERVPDYWGAELPVMRGRHNFERVRVDYYRDANTAFEAFKAGAFHILRDDDLARWESAYDFPAFRDGRILRAEFPHGRASGMSGIAFNTRRPQFADVRVRKALALLFDFDWINANYFGGAYARTLSYFDNSDLAAKGPPGPREAELLAPYADELDPAIARSGWTPPPGNDPAATRTVLAEALALLEAAGYAIVNGRMVAAETGTPLRLEVVYGEAGYERLVLAYARRLERLGIGLEPRRVDTSQFQRRWRTHEFDMIVWPWWSGTLSPGNEQTIRWSSAAAGQQGSLNLPGVRSAGVDAMIAALLRAQSREDLVAATRALDRLLLSGFYVIPLYHTRSDYLAWDARLGHPDRAPLTGFTAADYFTSWWWKAPPTE
ncbi:MAG: ABC transporter substrate-binding protein [Alphaproteobacteria bacterium]|nr:ABC transporter substrate-binding protein [Alphaproteobacteria bacterium]